MLDYNYKVTKLCYTPKRDDIKTKRHNKKEDDKKTLSPMKEDDAIQQCQRDDKVMLAQTRKDDTKQLNVAETLAKSGDIIIIITTTMLLLTS